MTSVEAHVRYLQECGRWSCLAPFRKPRSLTLSVRHYPWCYDALQWLHAGLICGLTAEFCALWVGSVAKRRTVDSEASHEPVHPHVALCPALPGKIRVDSESIWRRWRGPSVTCQTFPSSGAPLLGADATLPGICAVSTVCSVEAVLCSPSNPIKSVV